MDYIDQLNQRFGAPGRIAFRLSESGTPVLALVNGYGHCEISMSGGHLLCYRPAGHGPVLFMSREAHPAAGKVPHGGASICWPWIGKPSASQLPTDGFARLVDWNILSTEYDSKTTAVSLHLADTTATRAWWPHAFELVVKITLDDHLCIELTTRNTGDQPFAISQSINPYFRVRGLAQVSISGLEDCRFTDASTTEQATQAGPLEIKGATCRTYTDVPEGCVICDEGLGRNIAMTYSGLKNLIVLNPGRDQARASEGWGENDFNSVLTVAPAMLPEENVVLQPGASISVKTSIQATLR